MKVTDTQHQVVRNLKENLLKMYYELETQNIVSENSLMEWDGLKTFDIFQEYLAHIIDPQGEFHDKSSFHQPEVHSVSPTSSLSKTPDVQPSESPSTLSTASELSSSSEGMALHLVLQSKDTKNKCEPSTPNVYPIYGLSRGEA